MLESEIDELDFHRSLGETDWIPFRARDKWSGKLSGFSLTQTVLPGHKFYTKDWNG